MYQLSAEDVGCQIQVHARPIDTEEETGAYGEAFGQFGPIDLDPSAKQTLEQVLGTGGSQFPVSIFLKKNNNSKSGNTGENVEDDYEEENCATYDDDGIEGKMYVN